MNDTWSLPFATGVAVQRYLTAEEGLEAARDERCSHWYVDASLMEDMPHNWSKGRSQKLVEAAAVHGISPILHGNFRAPLASEIPEVRAASLDYVRSEIDLAARIEASALVIHGGAFVEPRPTKAHRDAALERFTSLLTVIEREAADKGVEVWLENLSYYPKFRPFSYVFTREADFETVLDAIPQVKFVLDVGHANVNQSLALPAFEAFAPSIAALSLSNNEGTQDAHLALGDGTLSVRELTDAIRAQNWSGVIAFETRNASVEAGIDYLRAMWEADADADAGLAAAVGA
ncbi:sugar phosphate isomerase/epimerase family protein [Streptomyces sp. BA2]|uniref:sugar phosphate isomerase/epimerase family protein n=1 Tax=Streptomyces sp. BA2 TaxID=436595 RepID=UPI001326716A|nr:sugar phosphate isomerase/epimerase family protein [Streptomyces sp. BA2]MWA14174.1 TIM barrel protein [Streptomyces sp. BA2]